MDTEDTAKLSEVSRIQGVFFEPSKTFRDIAQRPTWFLPMILTIAGAIGFASAVSQRIGWDRLVRQQMEANSRFRQAPPDQRQQAIDLQLRFMPVEFYAGAVLGPPMIYLAVAGVLLGMTALMSAGL